MTYQQQVEYFRQTPEGATLVPYSPEFNNAFNAFFSQKAAQAGVASFDAIPDNLLPPLSSANQGLNADPFANNSALNSAVNNALQAGAAGAAAGGNTQQVQGGAQTGNFETTGDQTSKQTSGQATNTTGSTTGSTVGATTNTSTGNTAGTTTGFTNNANESAGFSNLIGTNTGQTSTSGSQTGLQTNTGQSAQNTNLTTTGQTGSTNVGTTTGNTASTGTTTGTSATNTTNAYTGQTTGGQTTQGTSTTNVNDSLGFGALLKGAASGATADDATRRGFLTDLVQTGGNAFQDQVAAATNRALSGPGMVGTGDASRARAVGSAVGQVAGNNLNQRLAASQQLAGPSSLATLAGAANPYLGSTTTASGAGTNYGTTSGSSTGSEVGSTAGTTTGNTAQTGTSTNVGNTTQTGSQVGQTTGTTAGQTATSGASQGVTNTLGTTNQQGQTGQTGTSTGTTGQSTTGTTNQASTGTSAQDTIGTSNQNTLASGFVDLVNSEINKGRTNASNVAIASGQTPQQQTQSGGGCYVSSVLAVAGLVDPADIRQAVCFKLSRDRYMPIGYSLYGPALAFWTLRKPWRIRLMLPIVKAILHEELRLAGRPLEKQLAAWILHGAFVAFSSTLGWAASLLGRGFETRDPKMRELLIQHNLYFH